jgi:hypothetical protein
LSIPARRVRRVWPGRPSAQGSRSDRYREIFRATNATNPCRRNSKLFSHPWRGFVAVRVPTVDLASTSRSVATQVETFCVAVSLPVTGGFRPFLRRKGAQKGLRGVGRLSVAGWQFRPLQPWRDCPSLSFQLFFSLFWLLFRPKNIVLPVRIITNPVIAGKQGRRSLPAPCDK